MKMMYHLWTYVANMEWRSHRLERLLSTWIEDVSQKRISISQGKIYAKALSLFNDLNNKDDKENKNFTASNGLFSRFKQRSGNHNFHFVSESVSADKVAASKYLEELYKIIEEDGYKGEQIFNVDERGLFLKNLSSRTYFAFQERCCPNYKISKDWLKIFFRWKCSREFKIKPLLVYRAENPRTFKNVSGVQSSGNQNCIKDLVYQLFLSSYRILL